MKRKLAKLTALLLALSMLSGCSYFSYRYVPDLLNPDNDRDSVSTPTPSPTPEVEDSADVETPSPSPVPTVSPVAPSTWSTTTDSTEIATGVEYAASRGLLSAVSIYCKFTEETSQNGYSYGFGFSPFYGDGTGETQQNIVQSAGSGVIYWLDKESGSAFVITNYHVVYDVNSIEADHISDDITLYLYGSELEGMGIPATYVGGSMYYDLAVLYVENSELLKTSSAIAATFANSNTVSAGQTAIAVGNPEAGGISVSNGIVSVDSEYIAMTAVDEQTTISMRVMRIDTAVNSGNSGGGLFDDTGCLIGVVNAKISSTSVENIAYAIPSNIVRAISDNIIAHCYGTETTTVQRGMLGIMVATTASQAFYDEETRKTYIVETITVDSVNEGAAAEGLLQAGDVLTAITIDGVTTRVLRRYDVVDAMLAASVGSQVVLEYSRGGVTNTATIVMTEADFTSY